MDTLFMAHEKKYGTFFERTNGVKRRKLVTSRILHCFTVTGGCPA